MPTRYVSMQACLRSEFSCSNNTLYFCSSSESAACLCMNSQQSAKLDFQSSESLILVSMFSLFRSIHYSNYSVAVSSFYLTYTLCALNRLLYLSSSSSRRRAILCSSATLSKSAYSFISCYTFNNPSLTSLSILRQVGICLGIRYLTSEFLPQAAFDQ